MHPTTFAMKRAHLRGLALVRRILDPFGITPARLDALHILKATFPTNLPQTLLAERLGLCKSTVSRTLGWLERGKFIHRRRWPQDRRIKLVLLTTRGQRLLRLLRHGAVRDDVQAALDTVFRLPFHRVRQALRGFYADLRCVALGLGDTSKPPYTPNPLGDRPPLWIWAKDEYDFDD
jgi:DNA-binding MarR family transcriptional regulator